MMMNYWALVAVVRLIAALRIEERSFNVHDDLFSFPQYEILWRADAPVTSDFAKERLSGDLDGPGSASALSLSQSQSSHRLAAPFIESSIAGWESVVGHGQRYLCSIPTIPVVILGPPSNKTAAEEENESSLVARRGQELLQGMQGQCLYYVSGWWSYSFCYNESVRQFHPLPAGKNVATLPPAEDKSVDAYILGQFQPVRSKHVDEDENEHEYDDEGNSMKSRRKKKKILARTKRDQDMAQLEFKGQKGSTRYLAQVLKGGTICDLTGEERSIEVQFRCHNLPADRISVIKETAICQYCMVVDTPRLCNDAAFQPPQEPKPYPVSCHPVVPEEEHENWIEAHKAHEARNARVSREPDPQTGSDLEKEGSVEDMYAGVLRDIKAAIGLSTQARGETNQHASPVDDDDDDGNVGDNRKQTTPPLIRVGDIVVGGHNVVPTDVVLEQGVVVGGTGKEKHLGTIARSDGYTATEKDLLKFSMTGIKELENIKDQVKKAAAGEPWQIDVVQTARGKQLRGIIGHAADPAKKDQRAKQAKSKDKDGSLQDKESGHADTANGDDQGAQPPLPTKEGHADDFDNHGEQPHWPHEQKQGPEDEQQGSEETYKEEL